MIIGATVPSLTVQTFLRDESGDFVRDEHGGLSAVDVVVPSAWVLAQSVTVGSPGPNERRVIGTFEVFGSRTDAEGGVPSLGVVQVDAVEDTAKVPQQQAWEALIAAHPGTEIVSNGLPGWWPGLGHAQARIGTLLTPAQHALPIQMTDYNLVGLAYREVWEHGIPTRVDGYAAADVQAYEPTGQPIPRDGAVPVISEYLFGRPDDPNTYKHLVWWRVGNDPPNATFPGEAGQHPNVYATLRRPPIGGDVEKRDRAWRDSALTRALHVAAAGIIGYYAPQYPQHDPTTRSGQRALLDLERGYLAAEQGFFVNRGGSVLYEAIQASDKPWLDLPGLGGFATLRDRMLDELTPWAPA